MVFEWINEQIWVGYLLNYGRAEGTEMKVQNLWTLVKSILIFADKTV